MFEETSAYFRLPPVQKSKLVKIPTLKKKD